MKSIIKGNMLIAQSGGPSAVINRSLVGAILEARRQKSIKGIYGALHGIKGVLEEKIIDLRKESQSTLRAVAATPSSALGSVRKKPSHEDCMEIFKILQKRDIRYFFYIGGNDSAETAYIISQEAQKAGYEMRCFHIPKTIDNDLRENDHTPGYGSAARFVALAIAGIDLDNRALPGVHVSVVMGRHAGFLTAASVLARQNEGDGPHLIYLPERPFNPDSFVNDVKNVYEKFKRCVVVVSEGIADANGTPIVSKFTQETDSHGNVQLSGTGALGDLLANEIKAKTGISRVRADTFGYLQRSFPGVVSEVDAKEAMDVGAIAVKTAVKSDSDGSIAIKRKSGKTYKVYYECVKLQQVAGETRHMPDNFITKEANNVTNDFVEYALPIVGKLPVLGRFKGIRI